MQEQPASQKTTIRRKRKEMNWKQIRLASEAGVSLPVISRMETGKPIQFTSFKLVCQALGVRPDQIEGVCIYDAHQVSARRYQ